MYSPQGATVQPQKTVPELENEIAEALRNFPLGTMDIIASSREIPLEYKDSNVFSHAHRVYWQKEDLKAFLKTVDHHPV